MVNESGPGRRGEDKRKGRSPFDVIPGLLKAKIVDDVENPKRFNLPIHSETADEADEITESNALTRAPIEQVQFENEDEDWFRAGAKTDSKPSIEIPERYQEAAKEATESWYKKLARGTRDITGAAGSLLGSLFSSKNELYLGDDSILKDLGKDAKAVFIDSPKDALIGKDGDSVLRILVDNVSPGAAYEAARATVKTVSSEIAKSSLDFVTGEQREKERAWKGDFRPSYSPLVGAKETISDLANALGLRESKSAQRELLDRAAETAKYVLGGGFFKEFTASVDDDDEEVFLTSAEISRTEMDAETAGDIELRYLDETEGWSFEPEEGRKKDAFTPDQPTETESDQLAREALELEALKIADAEFAERAKLASPKVVNSAPIFSAAINWVSNKFTSYADSIRINAETKATSKKEDYLFEQAARLGSDRLVVAAIESMQKNREAEAAQRLLEDRIDMAISTYQSLLVEAEDELELMNQELITGSVPKVKRDELKGSMRALEDKMNRYEAAIRKLSSKVEDDKQRTVEHDEAVKTYTQLLKKAQRDYAHRTEILSKPGLMTGKAREFVEKPLKNLENKITSYQSVLESLRSLDKLAAEESDKLLLAA